ncbi:MAG: hypothetical protein K0R66_1732 [Gammaproteobacteria bacterium]|jgi:hypothetical protein|nr:hypothetical protein [Gammaproteobacteria bacterium]
MKRIVREISDWQIPGKEVILKHLGDLEKWSVKSIDAIDGRIWFEQPDGNQMWMPKDCGCVLEQITFEQAFSEYKSKPIVALFHEGVEYLSKYRYGDFDDYATVLVGFKENEFEIEVHDDLESWICESDEAQFYQAESWLDLHLNCIPTLIRMAREGA